MASEKSPDAYRTISEAAEETGLPAHVLRFWESKFAQLKPVKRKGGRRMYRPSDLALVRGLKRLLYEEGLTIKGAQKYVREQGVAAVSALADGGAMEPAQSSPDEVVARRSKARSTRAPGDVGAIADRLEGAKAKLDDAVDAAARGRA